MIPVLPAHVNGKLVFALCSLCAEKELNAPCRHTPEQRSLHGTWCTPEIHAALDRGYVMQSIDEVWHYEDSKSGLFAQYIDTWLKVKTEASGWPDNVVTEDQKQHYISEYQSVGNIQLEYEKIVFNAGLRALAKLVLNR